MANKLHTQEPWKTDGTGLTIYSESTSTLVATTVFENRFIAESDALRIVACVNACAGVPQDSFDGGWTALGMSQYAKSLEDKIDVLYGKINGVLLMGEIDVNSRSLLENALPK